MHDCRNSFICIFIIFYVVCVELIKSCRHHPKLVSCIFRMLGSTLCDHSKENIQENLRCLEYEELYVKAS